MEDEVLYQKCKPLLDAIQQEEDPDGLNQHAPGAKLDAGKPRPWLVLGGFRSALMEVAKVGTLGAVKYSDHGWRSVRGAEQRYLDAALRHLLAPEALDPESGLPHLAHAAWNVLAVLELQLEADGRGCND